MVVLPNEVQLLHWLPLVSLLQPNPPDANVITLSLVVHYQPACTPGSHAATADQRVGFAQEALLWTHCHVFTLRNCL